MTANQFMERFGIDLDEPKQTKKNSSGSRRTGTGGTPIDSPEGINMAVHFLQEEAPPAIEGEQGNNTTLKVAMRLGDWAISKKRAYALMLEHYNPRCSPEWGPEEMTDIVTHAYKYRGGPVGSALHHEATLSPLAQPLPPPEPLAPFSPKDLPPEQWIIERLLCRGYVTVLVSPPGTGKSVLSLQIAAAAASGRDDLLDLAIRERTRVWLSNNEDNLILMKRRFAGIVQHFILSWDEDLEIEGVSGVSINSGIERPLMMATRGSENKMQPHDVDSVIQYIKENNIGVWIADPFLETHQAAENSNEEINRVAAMYRKVAIECNCAVLLIHHTRKEPRASSVGYAGEMDSGRGASSLMGVARIVKTLYTMAKKDAESWGLEEEEHVNFIRLDDAKSNLYMTSASPNWLKRTNVELENSETVKTGRTSSVGVLVPTDLLQLSSGEIQQSKNDMQIQDTADVLNGQTMTIHAVANMLKNGYSSFSDIKSVAGVEKRLKSLFTEEQTYGGHAIRYVQRSDTNHGKHTLEVKKSGEK
ncbi:hypothetical protein MAIT1_04221 [Magnetofaba australis IT-1]|uniref:Uncharacterized protein n=2 Tax=Magnetofaba TaxID=1472292 RepID=A0A1Y2K794_9PROT|nr:hypothetical protein MAIT1_04221 [Magnetofaba australis IT-1]